MKASREPRPSAEYWATYEKNFEQSLLADEAVYHVQDIDFHKKKRTSLMAGSRVDRAIPMLVILGMTSKAKEYAELGIKHLSEADRLNMTMTATGRVGTRVGKAFIKSHLYRLKWISTGTEEVSILRGALDNLVAVVNDMEIGVEKPCRARELKQDIIDKAIKIGEFEVADRYLSQLGIPKSEAGKEPVYSDRCLLGDIVSALLKKDSQEASYLQARDLLVRVFRENLIDTRMILIYGIEGLIDLSYVFEKYFKRGESGLDLISIILRVRYG